MRVLLIPSLNVVGRKIELYVPYGLLALQAAAARLTDVEVEILQFDADLAETQFRSTDEIVDAVESRITSAAYDLIGMSTVCDSFHFSIDLASRLHQRFPSTKLLLGGPYVTKLAHRILECFPFVDGILVGEGEVSFIDLLLRGPGGDFNGIDGLRTQLSGGCPSKIVDQLDDLPFITDAKDFFGTVEQVRSIEGARFRVPLEATRGCPLQCSFCSTRQVWGAKVRRKSARRLIAEMQTIYDQTGDTFFSLVGDNMGVPRSPFLEFCQEFAAEESQFEWACSLKLDRIGEESFELMWDAGCRGFFIGVESASQETLTAVNKAANLQREISNIKSAIAKGFAVETSLIIGFPWETETDIRATFELHCEFLRLGARRSQVLVLCPIPGTDIVRDTPVQFDSWFSNLTAEDLMLSVRHKMLVESYPDLFSHFGHYDTPRIPRKILKAYKDAAAHVGGLHIRQRDRDLLATAIL